MTMITYKELSKSTWNDFETLFGNNGACGGCWCMYWRLKNKDFKINKGDGNKKAIKKLVKNDEHLGLLMYYNDEPAAWCAFAPREKYIRLETSRILKPVDDKEVLSIACFFIKRKFRRKGYSLKLINEVVKVCKKKNVKILEAYPVEPKQDNMGDAFAWNGIASAFKKAGFEEVTRRSETRPIMRYYF